MEQVSTPDLPEPVEEDPGFDPSPPMLDIGLGAVVLLGGIAIFVDAARFRPMIPDTVTGPGLLMQICGVIFVLTGLSIGIAAMRRKAGARVDLTRTALIVPGLLAGILILTPFAGFVPVGALATLLYIRSSGAGWIGSAIAAVILTGAVWLAFTRVMQVPLPIGQLFQ